MKAQDKGRHSWKAVMFPKRRRIRARCEVCGRNDCACEIRGDDPWVETPSRLTREDARQLGLEL